MKKEKKLKTQTTNRDRQFVSIEKRIAVRFGQIVSLCCIILGIITSVLNYIS